MRCVFLDAGERTSTPADRLYPHSGRNPHMYYIVQGYYRRGWLSARIGNLRWVSEARAIKLHRRGARYLGGCSFDAHPEFVSRETGAGTTAAAAVAHGPVGNGGVWALGESKCDRRRRLPVNFDLCVVRTHLPTNHGRFHRLLPCLPTPCQSDGVRTS